jgi:hypothetical protein
MKAHRSALRAPAANGPDKIDTWQDMEKRVQEVLESAQRLKRAAWHRFYDTRSAQGGYLPPQPSDFMLGYEGRLFFIEAKFSEVHESLRSCFSANVSDQQLASSRVWARACFNKYLVIFYSAPGRIVEVWDGDYLRTCRLEAKRLNLLNRRVYETVEDAIGKEVGYA